MKPYDDPNCKCYQIEKEIEEKYPDESLPDMGKACNEWARRSMAELEDNDIEFEDNSDSCYACTCPTCGRFICGACV